MKKTWKIVGIAALVTGALIYPAYKLVQYLKKMNDANKDEQSDDDHMAMKSFVPAYRGKKHKPHAGHN
jgi:hypothetical protein